MLEATECPFCLGPNSPPFEDESCLVCQDSGTLEPCTCEEDYECPQTQRFRLARRHPRYAPLLRLP